MKIRPVGAELFHVDGRTDRHDEANIRSCIVNTPKKWLEMYFELELGVSSLKYIGLN